MGTLRRPRHLRLWIAGVGLAMPGLVLAAYAAPSALAAGGPSGHQRKWLTPSDQPGLNAAANAAQKIIGNHYFTYAIVNTRTDTVSVYLDHAPTVLVSRLRAVRPGRYLIHNSSAHPESALLRLQNAISAKVLAWKAKGVRLGYLQPTPAGYDQVGVQSDVDRARSLLTAAYGQNWIRVVRDSRPAIPATFRYDDVAAWNGGDFIYHLNSTTFSDCTAGIPVHNTSTGTDYMLTASHCFWSFASNGVGTTVLNGYVESSHSVYPNSSTTLIGNVTTDSNVADGTTSLDVALTQASTSTVDFDDAWNSSGRAVQIGTSTNSPGDQVCTSGAFEGQVCSLVVRAVDQTACATESWGTFCVNHLAQASSNTSGVVAAGEGDSGGPVYSYSGSDLLANGMVDQISNVIACTSTPPGTSGRKCGTTVYYVEMPHINSNWGIAPNS